MLGRTRIARLGLFTAAGALALALALVPAAFAAKGGGGGHKGGGGTSGGSGTVSLVVVSSPYNDNLAHYGGQVSYTVSTASTAYPYVSTTCYQGSTLVLSSSAGFYASYAWPSAQIVPLQSGYWTSGSATCTAKLYSMDSGSPVTLATISFTALA
jgi:hypothetical protein